MVVSSVRVENVSYVERITVDRALGLFSNTYGNLLGQWRRFWKTFFMALIGDELNFMSNIFSFFTVYDQNSQIGKGFQSGQSLMEYHASWNQDKKGFWRPRCHRTLWSRWKKKYKIRYSASHRSLKIAFSFFPECLNFKTTCIFFHFLIGCFLPFMNRIIIFQFK